LSARRILSLWGPVAAFVVLLYVLSAQRQLPETGASDKVLHALAYMVLGLLSIRAFHGGLGPLAPKATALALVLTVGYGVFDEIHQAFVPGRHSSALDVVADAVGFLLAVVLMLVRYHAFRGARLTRRPAR
jgi:VanZ family protein